MTEKLPAELFRAISADSGKELDEIFNNHRKGQLWFHSPAHYRTIEDSRRRDELEGVGSYRQDGKEYGDVSDSKPGRRINPTYILCFSTDETAASARFAGPRTHRRTIQLADPAGLRNRILEKVLPCCKVITAEWRKVIYDKTKDISESPDPAAGWARKFWHKPEEFAAEEEWRLIITFRHSMPIINDRLELNLGDCHDLFPLRR